MNQKQIDFWKKAIDSTDKFMAPKHKLWKRLLQQYRLEFQALVLEKEPKKISRFYPLTRQIIASTAFFNPRVLLRVEEQVREFQAETMERIANNALSLQQAKREVQQQIFDTLYCAIGWIKMGVNPPGDEEMIAPYVANDSLINGMVFAQRRSPFDIFPDPLTPPHDLGQARFIREKMLAPLEFVMEDARFKDSKHRNKIKPLSKEEAEEHMLEDIQQNPATEEEERQAQKDLRLDGEYVLLNEIHDRIHKRMYVFAEGVEQPIEDVEHPFLAGQTITETDPFSGREVIVGFEATEGYLVSGGFPYIGMKFDHSFDSLYGLPMMAYGEETQAIIIESMSRRTENLKRGARMVVGNAKEKALNPNIEEEVEKAEDGHILWSNDPNNSFRELLTGNILPDQLGVESDARNYEDQTLNVGSTSVGGSRVTATQSALNASFGQLNREWLQDEVARVFETITYNNLRIMADRRYTPVNFIVNTAKDENDPVFEAMQSDMLKARFRVHIEAGSMKPLYDQLERDDALALFNYLIQIPEVPRSEALKLLLQAFRVPDIEKFLGDEVHADAVRAAQLENTIMLQGLQLTGGQPLQVHPMENHRVHLQQHQQLLSNPQLGQQMPLQQQQVMQVAQQHMQMHQQAMQQRAQGLRPATGTGANRNGNGAGPAAAVQQATSQVDSAVRSSAQTIGQKVSVNADQN